MAEGHEGVFAQMAKEGHEQVVFCCDRTTGLKCIIAIHDTTLGPALGGCRMWPYASEEEALADALRLAKGMTYKAAISGANHGGGKAVIWGDPACEKSEALFRALGRFVQSLGGRFLTGTDVGTEKEDFVAARMETPHVGGLPEAYGGGGDTAAITAYGVWQGMRAAAAHVWGEDSLKGRRVALQGLGKVGSRLLAHLMEEEAEVTVADVAPERVAEACRRFPGVQSVAPEAIYDVPCDIFAPCGLGGVLNDETIPRLRCRVVAGSANNQLQAPEHGGALHQRGILYAPDYVINAGGLIQVVDELKGYSRERAWQKVAGIYPVLRRIFTLSQEAGIPPAEAADRIVTERIEAIARVQRIRTSG